jgi:hypothetical protein
VTPIPKKDAPNDFTGVRPITPTPVFSKVYEQFLSSWLKEKIISMVDPKQFGSLPKNSTAHYLVSLLDKILKNLDNSGYWIDFIPIDLKKAFDLINHSKLIKTLLTRYIITPALVRIIANFLSDRKQRTKYKTAYSTEVQIYYGVPKGTILGPLFFLSWSTSW